MEPTRILELSDAERVELESLLPKTRDVRLHRRLLAILKVASGEPPVLVADELEVNVVTVYRWVRRYSLGRRASDLTERPRSGRPSKLVALADRVLEHVLERSPEDYGYRSNVWTVTLVRSHLKRHCGILVSDETLRRRLHQRDYRFKRPQVVFRDPDPHKGQKKGASFQP